MKKNKLLDDNLYSLDMLRINLRISSDDVQKFLNSIQCDIRYEYREMRSVSAYRHNFTVECENGHTFWIGLCPNSEKTSVLNKTVTVEFNPCKVGEDLVFINAYMTLLKLSKSKPLVKRFDLAIDMSVDRDKVHLVKDKRTYQEYRNSNVDLTQYLGRRSSHGFVKLYNKAKELKLSDYGLTRLELTIDYSLSDIDYVQALIPKLYIFDDFQFDFNITGTDKVLLLACLSDMSLLNELPRDKKKKIKEVLDGSSLTLELDTDSYTSILSQIDGYVNP